MEKHDYEIIIDGHHVPIVFKDVIQKESTPQPFIAYYKWTTNFILTDRGIMITIWRGNTQWQWWSKQPFIIEKKVHDRTS